MEVFIHWHIISSYPSEVKDLMYDFNYFKIVGILHINMWHVAKHFIVLWHVTISFFMVIKLTPWLTLSTKINQYVQALSIENQSNICVPHIYLWQKYFNASWIVCHVLFKYWLYAMYVSTFYMYIDEHNKNEL